MVGADVLIGLALRAQLGPGDSPGPVANLPYLPAVDGAVAAGVIGAGGTSTTCDCVV